MSQVPSSIDSQMRGPTGDLLLATKLFIPPVRPGLVPRPQLLARLDQGLSCRLILVSGPAGGGKTTLLSEWLAQATCLAAWLSLDPGDGDPARFLGYLIAALRTVLPGAGKLSEALLQGPQLPPLETLLTALINDIAATAPPGHPLALVLDDYHAIASPAIHDGVTFLLEHLPPQMHLVIATRTDPPLPLSRFRSRGQMIEIRAGDLRFTTEEAAAFLNRTMGLDLSPEDVATLEARTEGWVAGLQMAALSMQGRQDVAAFIRSFSGSHRYVLDYLVEEAFGRQPAAVRAFLLHTSVLERLTAPLCEAVTGEPGAQAMLEGLERANLFLVPLDDERRWYRYHHLFVELLRASLAQDEPGQAALLRVRASEWCEGRNLVDEAVGYALAAGDHERAARLAEDQVRSAYISGMLWPLRSWIDRLPGGVTASHPRLGAYKALALALADDCTEAEALLRSVEGAARSHAPAPEARDLLGMVAAIRAYEAFVAEDLDRADALAREAADGAAEGNPLRTLAFLVRGDVAYINGDLVATEQAWSEALRLARMDGGEHIIANAKMALALVERMRGRLDGSLALNREALEIETRLNAPRVGDLLEPLVGIADVLRERDDLEAAEQHVVAAIRSHRPGDPPNRIVSVQTVLARVRLARNDLTGAASALEEAGRILPEHHLYPDVRTEWAVCRVQLWLAQSRTPPGSEAALAAAVHWAEEQRLRRGKGQGWVEELEQIGLARVLLAQGKAGEAAELLAGLAEAAAAGGRNGRLIEILALLALALRAQGETARALDALTRALSLAEPEGYVRVFADEGPPMAALLRALSSQRPAASPGYVARLLAALGAAPAQVGRVQAPAGRLVEPLSARELEVLQLLAEGLTNQEVAQRLFVTLATVKSHTLSIYGKLGVHSRREAVAAATRLGLLP